MRNLRDGSYLGAPLTRQQSPSSLQTTAADAVAAVNVSAVTVSTRALLMLFITFSVAV